MRTKKTRKDANLIDSAQEQKNRSKILLLSTSLNFFGKRTKMLKNWQLRSPYLDDWVVDQGAVSSLAALAWHILFGRAAALCRFWIVISMRNTFFNSFNISIVGITSRKACDITTTTTTTKQWASRNSSSARARATSMVPSACHQYHGKRIVIR